MDHDEHRRLRELLGAFALGDLPQQEVAGLCAHLDGCAACRAELAEIAPLAADLRGVDASALSSVPTPPADLGDRIRQQVSAERALADARTRRDQRRSALHRSARRTVAAAAVLALSAGALGAGTVLGRSTAPEVQAAPSSSPSGPKPVVEQVTLRTAVGLQADSAGLIAHTWGVEARFTGSGFVDGRVYRAAFRARDGRMVPAGEFLGTGDRTLTCNMQSALLRADATRFVVVDDAGTEVLTATL